VLQPTMGRHPGQVNHPTWIRRLTQFPRHLRVWRLEVEI
jgi:hypothetical protein